MHDGTGWGGLLVVSLLVVLLAVVVAIAVAFVARSGWAQSPRTPPEGRTTAARSARRVLDERYARGEIDDDEYVRRSDLLRSGRT